MADQWAAVFIGREPRGDKWDRVEVFDTRAEAEKYARGWLVDEWDYWVEELGLDPEEVADDTGFDREGPVEELAELVEELYGPGGLLEVRVTKALGYT